MKDSPGFTNMPSAPWKHVQIWSHYESLKSTHFFPFFKMCKQLGFGTRFVQGPLSHWAAPGPTRLQRCTDPAGSSQLWHRKHGRAFGAGHSTGTQNKARGRSTRRMQRGQEWRLTPKVIPGQKPGVGRAQKERVTELCRRRLSSVGPWCYVHYMAGKKSGVRLCSQNELTLMMVLALICKFFFLTYKTG